MKRASTESCVLTEIAPAPAPGADARYLFALLGGYFVLQIILRMAFPASLDLDESEAVMLAQGFHWGYGSQAPLYTWLQMLVFGCLGPSVLGLSVLKNLLLLSTYCLTFATTRALTRNTAGAIAAALSLLFLPQVAWESQRDLTHSVLSATLSMATLYCFVRIQQSRSMGWYLLLGLAAGCGLLSKYNYVLWLAGLLGAGLTLREFRSGLLNFKMLLALIVSVLIFLPHAVWMLSHRELVLSSADKLAMNQSFSWLTATALGLKSICQSLLAFCTPITLVYLALFIRAPVQPALAAGVDVLSRKLLVRAWLMIGAMLLLLVICTGATEFKERWFQPILIALPVLGVTVVQSRLDAPRRRRLVALSVLVMLAVICILPGRLLLAERLHREEPLTRPFAGLGAQMRPVIPDGSVLVCETRLLAGNLRLRLPRTLTLTPELSALFYREAPHCFLVWDASRNPQLPASLSAWARQVLGDKWNAGAQDPSKAKILSAVYQFHRTKQYRLAVLQLY